MRLNELLRLRGTKVPTVADRIGEPRNTVWRWFRGKTVPPLEKAIKLADFFAVSLDVLAGRDTAHETLSEGERSILRLAGVIGIPEAERRLMLAKAEPGPAPRAKAASSLRQDTQSAGRPQAEPPGRKRSG